MSIKQITYIAERTVDKAVLSAKYKEIMKRFITTILFFTLLALMTCNAFETHFMSVDFEKMQLIYKDKVYELIEIRNRVKHHHREITYLCIDEDCKAVAFRLFVTDGGEYMKLQKYNSKK